ncbi:MAG: RimK family alpha-L-glutamate ligase [Planctomycetota bacterium]
MSPPAISDERCRLLVVGPDDGWHVLDLQRAAQQAGLFQFRSVPFESLSGSVDPNQQDGLARPADVVLTRGMPTSSLEQVVFRMDLLARWEAAGVYVVNRPKAIEASVDKYLSLALLQSAGLSVPLTHVSQSVDQAMDDFVKLGCRSVLKPIFGSLGKGIELLNHRDEALTSIESRVALGRVIYQQEFIDHGGVDVRVFVIGDRVLGMKRVNDGGWITNIHQGGRGVTHQPTEEEKAVALAAANAVGAEIAGVDLVYEASSRKLFVLEVNAAPGWRKLAQVLKLDVASMILSWIQKRWQPSIDEP